VHGPRRGLPPVHAGAARERTEDGVYDVCGNAVHAHAGAVVSRGYRHRLHLVAEALVAVGRGVSYTRAAQRARERC